MRAFSERELATIMSFGALHYTPRQMADNLDDITEEEIITLLKDPNSEFTKAYERGKSRAQFKIDLKLLELAQSGDLEALKLYERRLRENDAKKSPMDEAQDDF